MKKTSLDEIKPRNRTVQEAIQAIRREWDQMKPEEQVMLYYQERYDYETLDQFNIRMLKAPKSGCFLIDLLEDHEERDEVITFLFNLFSDDD